MQKYIGQVMEIIYLDHYGKLSQRKIEIRTVRGSMVFAFCLEKRKMRTFRVEIY
ncbi:hypothetical protein [Paenibacillus eucommiae]|uniref:DNA-binding transcriptional regulator YafY n=1 Tax=Paenibacillus eucommiae TaxID=1355755 RepID=A0ABS4J7J4_9BACL|nr:hypothetical protein [Paenibacillus eucommiae]MBP1995215.1 putative DNA-binding transcriptional regulator YafY [Paenibacillus eucommiae]